MRTVHLLMLLALGCHGTPPSELDTDAADSDVADSDLGDTDPVRDTTDTAWVDTGAPDCVLPLDAPLAPTTWAEVSAFAAAQCVSSANCVRSSGADAMVSWGDCESGVDAYYREDGALFAEHRWDDIGAGICDTTGGPLWYGDAVGKCSVESSIGLESAPCATPEFPPSLESSCLLTDALTPRVQQLLGWTSVARMSQAFCLGLSTCVVGDRTLDLVYHDATCQGGDVDAWDHATGELVATLMWGRPTQACGDAPAWRGVDLSACFPAEFVPSEACGVATLGGI